LSVDVVDIWGIVQDNWKDGEVVEKVKRTRRSEDQLLTDTITALYEKIQKKIVHIEDERAVVEEVFEALAPLRELEDMYRGNR